MRTCIVVLFLVSASLGLAQQVSEGAPAIDTLLIVELAHTLDSKRARVGDPVAAKLHDDVVVDGKVLAPREKSRIIGHVSEAQPLPNHDAQSKLAIVFDKIVLKDGRELPISAVILHAVKPSSQWSGSGSVPTSGDDPIARAAGPRVDSSGNPVIPSHPPTSQPGPIRAPSAVESARVALAYDAAGQATIMSSAKANIKIESGTILTLRLTKLPSQP